jgi:hypothetical protein
MPRSVYTHFSMKRILILTLLTASAYAVPPVELIHFSDFPHVARLWQHGGDVPFGTATSASPPKPIRLKGGELKGTQPGDSLFWDEYTGQAIQKGDAFLFVYQGEITARECGAVGPDYVKTVLGTTVKLSDVKGTVRRIIRVID